MAGMARLSGILTTLVGAVVLAPPLTFSPGPSPSQSSLFKHAKREDVVGFAPTVLSQLSSCGLATSDNTLLRKLNIKLAQVDVEGIVARPLASALPPPYQRLGTTFLKVRVASWRYQRGSRSLEETLAAATVSTGKGPSVRAEEVSHEGCVCVCLCVYPVHPVCPQEEGYDVPGELEEVLGLLLCGLKDRDTVVRWSAAKG